MSLYRSCHPPWAWCLPSRPFSSGFMQLPGLGPGASSSPSPALPAQLFPLSLASSPTLPGMEEGAWEFSETSTLDSEIFLSH